MIPCNHDPLDSSGKCPYCRIVSRDIRYARLYGVEHLFTGAVAMQPTKPRLSIQELAEKKERCRQAKAAGQECKEFPT